MEKHGLGDQMPFFRMKISNEIPWLGEFPHSPIHLYVKKEGSEIVEISQLKSPFVQGVKAQLFLNEIKAKLNNVEFNDKIKIDALGQFKQQINKLDILEEFDIDFDAKPDYITMAERNKNK